jgi:hypothetical protein
MARCLFYKFVDRQDKNDAPFGSFEESVEMLPAHSDPFWVCSPLATESCPQAVIPIGRDQLLRLSRRLTIVEGLMIGWRVA